MSWGGKDIGIRKSEFVAKNQFLCLHFDVKHVKMFECKTVSKLWKITGGGLDL